MDWGSGDWGIGGFGDWGIGGIVDLGGSWGILRDLWGLRGSLGILENLGES